MLGRRRRRVEPGLPRAANVKENQPAQADRRGGRHRAARPLDRFVNGHGIQLDHARAGQMIGASKTRQELRAKGGGTTSYFRRRKR